MNSMTKFFRNLTEDIVNYILQWGPKTHVIHFSKSSELGKKCIASLYLAPNSKIRS